MKHLFTWLASIPLWLLALPVSADDVSRPNVLMIIADDLNDWVGCLGGHPDVRTPNIDRLARRGLLLANAHCAAPVCNPSRVATFTGRRPSTTGIYDNSVVWHEALPGIASIPQHFKANGYYTAGGGKVYHHMPGFNRRSDWNEYFDQVFDSHFHRRLAAGDDPKRFAWPDGFPLNGLPNVKALTRPPQNPNEFDWGPFDTPDDEMGDAKMVQWAEKFLGQPPRQPFFLAAGIYRPHLPWYAPRRYFDMYPPERVTPPPLKADDLDDLPAGGREMAANRAEDLVLVRQAGQYERVLQAYLANVTFCDTLVGRLLDALDGSPAAKNTIIVFWSDNGFHLGEKQHLHKFTLWDRSTRLPLIVAAPGVTQADTRSNRPVGFVDLFPTLNELCGLPAPADLDGVSFVPLLTDPQHTWDQPALTTHGLGNHALRNERWRYIRYADGGEELYDHQSDPNEWTNLADRPEFTSVIAELARSLPQTDAPARRSRKRQARTSSREEPAAATASPAISPYPMSSVIGGFTIEPGRQSIGHGDNWAITWAGDDRQYSFHTDGRGFGLKESVSTAPVIIEGNPPDIRGRDIATTSGNIPNPNGQKSRKVSGVVMIQDVLYAWVRNLNPSGQPKGTGSTLMFSRNQGKDWSFVEWSFPNIGYPSWLNAGKNYRAAQDHYAYFVAPDGPSAYADYQDLLMARVPVDAILDKSRYEFFHGTDQHNSSIWGDYERRQPVFSDLAGCFRPDIVFNPGLNRYFLMMSSPIENWHWWANDNPTRKCHFGLFDAPNPWGPWTTVAYFEDWGMPETRFAPHIPPKWISDDGTSFYLLYSCIPTGPYRFNIQRCQIEKR